MNDLTDRLRKLAEHWRSVAREHDECRLQLRLNGAPESDVEYQVEKAEAQTLHNCAYHLLRHLDAT